MIRTSIIRQAGFAARQANAVRLFTTTTRMNKGPIDVAKDVLKKVDRTVSDAAVKGIETGGKS